MIFNPLVPELYVLDFKKSLDFYVHVLGFKVEYRRENPQFVFLSYQGSQLMIQQEEVNDDLWHNGVLEYPFGRGVNLQIRTDDAQGLITILNKINYPLKRGLKESWYQAHDGLYGYQEFLIMDFDGYLLRFSQPL